MFAVMCKMIAESSGCRQKNGKSRKNRLRSVCGGECLVHRPHTYGFCSAILGNTDRTTTKQNVNVADGKAKFTALPSVMYGYKKMSANTPIFQTTSDFNFSNSFFVLDSPPHNKSDMCELMCVMCVNVTQTP